MGEGNRIGQGSIGLVNVLLGRPWLQPAYGVNTPFREVVARITVRIYVN